MYPTCQSCLEPQDEASQEFYDRECICDKCWEEWELEKKCQENEYRRSRL